MIPPSGGGSYLLRPTEGNLRLQRDMQDRQKDTSRHVCLPSGFGRRNQGNPHQVRTYTPESPKGLGQDDNLSGRLEGPLDNDQRR